MLEMLRGLFEQGYRFVEESYYGFDVTEDFEDVEDAVAECEDSEYLSFQYEVDHDRREVHYMIEDDE